MVKTHALDLELNCSSLTSVRAFLCCFTSVPPTNEEVFHCILWRGCQAHYYNKKLVQQLQLHPLEQLTLYNATYKHNLSHIYKGICIHGITRFEEEKS